MRHLGLACFGLVMAAGAMAATPTVDRYAEGQVWEYQTRPGDQGSLLKIQKIEVSPQFTKSGPVYHVSIIGIHFDGLPVNGTLQHAPFSRASLDASVTKLSASKAEFPDANGGIAANQQSRPLSAISRRPLPLTPFPFGPLSAISCSPRPSGAGCVHVP